jgi:hypothetical protein
MTRHVEPTVDPIRGETFDFARTLYIDK